MSDCLCVLTRLTCRSEEVKIRSKEHWPLGRFITLVVVLPQVNLENQYPFRLCVSTIEKDPGRVQPLTVEMERAVTACSIKHLQICCKTAVSFVFFVWTHKETRQYRVVFNLIFIFYIIFLSNYIRRVSFSLMDTMGKSLFYLSLSRPFRFWCWGCGG